MPRPKEFRSKTEGVKDLGAYTQVFQRPDMDEPLIDLNFFDGDKTIAEVKRMRTILDAAIAKAEEWNKPEVPAEAAPGVPKCCASCSYSFMEPDDMNLTCGHPDTNNGGFGLHIRTEPLPHCAGFSKWEQHPRRNPDGTLKLGSLARFFTEGQSG